MPNKSEINRELVKAFNSILHFNDKAFTNCTVDGTFSYKEDHIVILFDKNMTINQREEYLKSVKEKVIERFCPHYTIFDDIFYTKFFPFSFDPEEWAEDNKFLVPIRKEVISNLKYLLANEIARFATSNIIDQKKEGKKSELGCEDLSDDIEQEIEEYVDDNIIDEVFDKGSYLYGAKCVDGNLQRSFVKLLSSRITDYENGPKKTKDFLEEKGNYVYLKKSIFDNPKLVKDIVKHIVSLTCRCFDTPNTEDEMNDTLKFAVVDLIRKALPHLPISSMWHTSHKDSEDEYSILAPVIDCGTYIEFLNEKEVDHINNEVFGGTKVLCDVKNDIAERALPTYGAERIYAIDFFKPDIDYCIMNKITESSLISEYKVKDKDTGKDKVKYKLSIDPARVPAMKPQTLAPSEEKVCIDGPSVDSGFGGSPKGRTIHAKNSRKLLSPNYYDEDAQGIKDDNSAKDSGFCASSARSSFDNKPKPMLDKPSASQPDQCSAKKRTSISKKSTCCIL